MLILLLAEFFKSKVVGSVIVLACGWCTFDQVNLIRQLSDHGVRVTFSCDPDILSNVVNHRFQGVLYLQKNDNLLAKIKREHFSHWYKWLVIGEELPTFFNGIRFDSDIGYLKLNPAILGQNETFHPDANISIEDVFMHPSEGASLHPWAYWSSATGLTVTDNDKRISRRLNLKRYPLKIVAPSGYYSSATYNGSFTDYLMEQADPHRDAAIRCAYRASSLVIETLNASEILLETIYWSSQTGNDSMLRKVQLGLADMTGAILRILHSRVEIMDFLLPLWPFRVGFTYLAERESSSNMYIEPFSATVWWTCLGIGIVLAFSQRITAKRPEEKEGAFMGVLATWLQQDASAVPEGVSGRWSFMVMSMSAMLVHAYYTSAIVSSLMSTDRGGPDSLRALGDSKYAIASEDYEYMRYLFWDVDTNRSDLEYLKKKKMTSKLFQDMKTGIELIKGGSTAYHTEYNQIYPHFNTLTNDQLCKLQYIDTVPEQLSWTTTTKRGHFTNIFRSKGAWLHETGLANRLVTQLRMRPPPCRSALLAERVTFGDVTPLLVLSALGAAMSMTVLGIEVLYAKWKPRSQKTIKDTEGTVN